MSTSECPKFKNHFIEKIGRDIYTGVLYYNVVTVSGKIFQQLLFEVIDERTKQWKTFLAVRGRTIAA